jgi:hypothetical protein
MFGYYHYHVLDRIRLHEASANSERALERTVRRNISPPLILWAIVTFSCGGRVELKKLQLSSPSASGGTGPVDAGTRNGLCRRCGFCPARYVPSHCLPGRTS